MWSNENSLFIGDAFAGSVLLIILSGRRQRDGGVPSFTTTTTRRRFARLHESKFENSPYHIYVYEYTDQPNGTGVMYTDKTLSPVII